MSAQFRRIVTGHDADGFAVIASDGPPVRVETIGTHGPVFHEIWNTREMPARIDRDGTEPHEVGLVLAPPPGGTRIRIVDFPPEDANGTSVDAQTAREHFEQIGAVDALAAGVRPAPHPFMHRTETIDYGIILDGEITLIVDKGDTLMRAGDVVIQKGTNHAWANRSDRNCRIAFILIDGDFDDGL